MLAGLPLARRVPRPCIKTITFDGTTVGAQGALTVFTVTGAVLITELVARCKTLLAGASATIELGVAGNTAALIAQTTATDIDAGEFWQDSSPEAGVSPAVTMKAVTGNIIATIGTADITSGVLEITAYWKPLSADGNLA